MRRVYRVDKKRGIRAELYKDSSGWGFNIKSRSGVFYCLCGAFRTKAEAIEEFKIRWNEAVHAEDFA